VREASTLFSFGHAGAYDHEDDCVYLGPDVTIVDIGDADIVHTDTETSHANIETGVRAMLDAGALPVVIGGDHSVNIPCIRAFAGRGPIHILQIDAHLDFVDVRHGVRHGHGNPMRRAAEQDHVTGITALGIRNVSSTTQEGYEAARVMGAEMSQSTAAVVGATGAIGSACAQLLAREVGHLIMVGRREGALLAVREKCEGQTARLTTSTDMHAIYQADLIIAVTSAVHAVVEPQHLKPGAVVCDVARPRDVSWRVAQERDDVLVIEGGMVEVPGEVDFHFDFGFPPGKSYACMAETMILALEGRVEDYTIGKDITIAQAQEIGTLAQKHGFKLAGFRSFEKPVTDEQIALVRERALTNRRTWSPENLPAIP